MYIILFGPLVQIRGNKMAPKIIDKKRKRQELAFKAYDFISTFGIKKFSTTSFIKYLDIGKSSFYHYFKSKDEIICEIYYQTALDDIQQSINKIKPTMGLEEKLEIVFEFYLCETNTSDKEFYMEFLNIYADKKIDIMREYDKDLMQRFQQLLTNIFEEEIIKNSISPIGLELINSMIITADGMLMYSFTIEDFNLQKEFKKYLISIIKLLKTTKCIQS